MDIRPLPQGFPIRSSMMECVSEAMQVGITSPTEIAIAYGLNPNTVQYYKWVLSDPERFVKSRVRTRERKKALRIQSGTPRGHGGHRSWAPSLELRLMQLVQFGYSYSQMAAILGCSRNAIAGKVHRLHRRLAKERAA